MCLSDLCLSVCLSHLCILILTHQGEAPNLTSDTLWPHKGQVRFELPVL